MMKRDTCLVYSCHCDTSEAAQRFAFRMSLLGTWHPSILDAIRPRGLGWGVTAGRGLCLGAGKTRSQKNVCKSGRIPTVGCTLCLKTRTAANLPKLLHGLLTFTRAELLQPDSFLQWFSMTM